MSWYDCFASIYDANLEKLYAVHRQQARDALELAGDELVLDVPVGTGASLEALVPALPRGRVLGLDLSPGMLRRAEARARRKGWSNVILREADVHAVTPDFVEEATGRRDVDRIQMFLGLTVFPRWREAFDALWGVLAPGGRVVVVDTYAAEPGLQGWLVQLMAQADIRRPVWEPLQVVGQDVRRELLSDRWEHGGELWLAAGRKG